MTIDEAVRKMAYSWNVAYRPNFGESRIIIEPHSDNPYLCQITQKEANEMNRISFIGQHLPFECLWAPSPDDLIADDWEVESWTLYSQSFNKSRALSDK